MPLISLEVTPDIAAKIRAMAEAGVFAINKGSATINFLNGELKSVKTEIYSYPSYTQSLPVDVDLTHVIQ